jgi:hypothetical protein
MGKEMSEQDGVTELAKTVGAIVAWVIRARIQMGALALITKERLNMPEEDWQALWDSAIARAESTLPPALKQMEEGVGDLETIREFLGKL